MPTTIEQRRENQRKWYRANREKKLAYSRAWRKAHREEVYCYNLKWQQENPEKYAAVVKHSTATRKLKRIRKAQSSALFRKTNTRGQSARREIMRHLERGRDVGRIAVWMGLPVSAIQKVINEISLQSCT